MGVLRGKRQLCASMRHGRIFLARGARGSSCKTEEIHLSSSLSFRIRQTCMLLACWLPALCGERMVKVGPFAPLLPGTIAHCNGMLLGCRQFPLNLVRTVRTALHLGSRLALVPTSIS